MEYILYSNAKINLFLHLVGRNEKNYHFIQSAMSFIDLKDKIHIKKSNDFNIEFQFNHNLNFPIIDKEENSIIKIIKEFSKKFDLDEKFSIFIEKHIPSGAGLGGGSANAATILNFLESYYSLKLSMEEKKELSLKIGCDTIACLYNKPIFVQGIGEKISKCNLDKKILNSNILIIYPQIFSSSIEAYKLFKEKKYQFSNSINFYSNKIITFDFLKNCINDLTTPICDFFPEVNELLKFLESRCSSHNTIVRMSGSGSICFVLSEDNDLLINIENEIKSLHPKYFSKICRFI
jgi:4-diphosphocytidyl-2-C-methyl-D-erythritol kinase